MTPDRTIVRPPTQGLPLRWWVLVPILAVSACATVGPANVELPPLDLPDSVIDVPDIDTMALSPAMEAFLDRYILEYKNLDTRARLLTLSVVSRGVLGFEYEETSTLTAAQAFERRSGNCVSHANMVVALARRAGLDAKFQEIIIQPEWSSRDDTVLVNKHVNVALSSPRTTYHIDVSGRETRPDSQRRIVSDRDARAMYFNNLGALALVENDLPRAYAYIKKSIETSPRVADSWVNLGVVMSRNRQLDDAELAHRTALQIDWRQYSAMNNLYSIYRYQGRTEEADKLKKKVDAYRRKNPYYLLRRSNDALKRSEPEQAIKLLQRAIKIKTDDHRLHFAMAKAQYLSGNLPAAERSLRLAREQVPPELAALYTKPLDQLVTDP